MHPHEARTSELLQQLAADSATTTVSFEELLSRFGNRAFGVLLIAVTLPAFLPLPAGAGAISGPLVALLGLQMLLGLRRPWLPAALRRRGFSRERLASFNRRTQAWLQRLERLSRPRLEGLLASAPGQMACGLLILLLGLLLSLPIPLTNYPLALLILCMAVALIERDGALMLLLGLLAVVGSGALLLLSGEMIGWLRVQLS